MNNIEIQDNWTTVIKPKAGLFQIQFKEIWRYRDLIALFVHRDFVAVYKQTILGPLWFLIQPIFTTVIYTVIFGKIAKIPTDGIPQILFYFSGIVCWNYFSSCLSKTSDTFFQNAGIFGKVYFPRFTVPLSVIITNLISFSIQFSLFIVLLIYFYFTSNAVKPGLLIVAVPFILLQTAALGLGTGILISSLTTRYRDFTYLISFGTSLWMYATPVVYPISQVPENWRFIYTLNPMASIVGTFRYAFLGVGGVSMNQYLIGLLITLTIFFTGVLLFNRTEKTFMDTI